MPPHASQRSQSERWQRCCNVVGLERRVGAPRSGLALPFESLTKRDCRDPPFGVHCVSSPGYRPRGDLGPSLGVVSPKVILLTYKMWVIMLPRGNCWEDEMR